MMKFFILDHILVTLIASIMPIDMDVLLTEKDQNIYF